MADNSFALKIEGLTKEYKLYDSEFDRFKEAFSLLKKKYHKSFYALKDISFEVKPGEKVGIIGTNGAGKSTLLKIITGVLKQTSGEVIANGKVAALLELGAGFNPEYTGIENIRLNCTLMGFSRSEIEDNIQRIIDFADIGDFINQPVKTYSSGMFVRLAFATQILSRPDILIVDEALSVGDIRFQQKCYRAMDEMMKDKTVILVSHDTDAVRRFCNRGIWLNHGKVMFDGNVDEALKQYKEAIMNEMIAEKKAVGAHDYDYGPSLDCGNIKGRNKQDSINVPPLDSSVKVAGNQDAYIYECGLFTPNYELAEIINPGDEVICIVRAEYKKEIAHPIIGISIRNRLGLDVVAINSQTLDIDMPLGKGKQEYHIKFVMPDLNHGKYTMTIAIANGYQNDHVQMCWADDALLFTISQREYDVPGVIYMQRGEVEILQI